MVAEGKILPALRTFAAPKPGERAFARALFAPLLMCLAFASNSTESAIANGETRTISLSNSHTDEAGSFTYMVDGVYDSAVLEKLNWFLRDWRHDEKTNMDPRLFDVVWEVYRESGSSEPIDVLSGYRSPETNAMLRRRSRQVAAHSQHMMGKAMDAHFIDVPTSKIRDIAMRLQAGGVGFYPTGNTPWVHIELRICSILAAYEPRSDRAAFPGWQDRFHPVGRRAARRLPAGCGRNRGARRRDLCGERRDWQVEEPARDAVWRR